MDQKIVSLPKTGFAPTNADIAALLEQQAAWIRDPDAAPIRNVFLIIECEDGEVVQNVFGMQCDVARHVGMLTICAAKSMYEQEE